MTRLLPNGLKSILPDAVGPHPFPPNFEPRATIREVMQIQRRFDVLSENPPPNLDFAAIRKELEDSTRSLFGFKYVSPRTLRLAPWVICYPIDKPKKWLFNNQAFANSYIKWLQAHAKPSSIGVLFRSFVYNYPVKSPLFKFWREALATILAKENGTRLAKLQKYCNYTGYLEPEGSHKFARILAQNPQADFQEDQSGLTPKLRTSEFIRHTLTELLAEIQAKLSQDSANSEWLLHCLELIEGEDRRLRFVELQSSYAESLLKPFINTDPSSELKDLIRNRLLRHFKDPRFKGNHWPNVQDNLRRVMTRWLVEIALEDFFNLLDDTAYQFHWEYRRAFWSAYLRKGLIEDAWVVLGRSAKLQAKRYRGEQNLEYGKLIGGTASHSVLLLKIRNLIISEWSHNGACRIFLSDNSWAPKFYRDEYSTNRLINDNADGYFAHRQSESGKWQYSIASYVRDHTGIMIDWSDYMP